MQAKNHNNPDDQRMGKARTVMEQIEEYRRQGANILKPSVRLEEYSEFHQPVVDIVRLDPDPNAGDVYPNGAKQGTFFLHYQAYLKLANCAQIAWDPYKSGQIPGDDPDIVTYQAVGGIRQPDGTLSSPMVSTYSKNMHVIEDDLKEQYEAKARKNRRLKTSEDRQDYINYCVKRDMRMERRHAVTKAESGAKARVIKSILNTKSHYTRQELQQPFVMVRVVFRPDYNDPLVKQTMLLAAANAAAGVFGMPAPNGLPAPPIGQPGATVPIPHPDTQPDTLTETPLADPGPEPPYPDTDTNRPQEAPASFEQMDRGQKIRHLEELARHKGYNLVHLQYPLEDFNDTNLTGFYEKLMAMEDQTDDIPF